jgi:outer membrane protein assembly factor BamC
MNFTSRSTEIVSMHGSRKIVVLLVPLMISGCGWLVGDEGFFRDRSNDYRKARSIPAMQLPEGKSAAGIEQIYAIPVERTDALLGEEFEVPRPAPLVGDQDQSGVKIQKLGAQQWILIEEAPAAAWPRIRTFLLANHIEIEREDAATGQMETAWLAFKDDENKREKYRVRVEQGVQRNSTEVYVLQKGYTKKEDGAEVALPEWAQSSMDPERESWMVRQIAEYIADTGTQSSVSLLAQGISTVSKVYLIRDEANNPVIDLRLPFERAWASLERALDRSDFSVTDKDLSGGVFFIKYDPTKVKEEDVEKRGFFSRLFGWGDDDDRNPVKEKNVYRIEVKSGKDGVLIGVRRDDGKAFDDGEAEYVLTAIKTHLA